MRTATATGSEERPRAAGRRQRFWLPLLGAVQLALTVLAASRVELKAGFIPYSLFYLAMCTSYLVACHRVLKSEGKLSRGEMLTVIGFALAMRVVFLVTEPILSDDIFRYVWDGRVQHEGINPYSYPPEAEALSDFRNELYPGINNKDIRTIYPPLMQIAFFLTTSVTESLTGMKLSFLLADLLLIWILIELLKATGLSPRRVLVYAWSPLVVVEIAGSGHNDVLSLVLLVAANLFLLRGATRPTVVYLTLSGLAKLAGIALAPLFARFVPLRHWWPAPLLAIGVAMPYWSAGAHALEGLTQYGLRWRGNDSLYHLLFWLTDSLEIAKLIAAALLGGLTLVLMIKKTPPLRACYLTLGAILTLMPTVHPWYLVWIVPYLAIYPNPAWLYLTASVVLAYHAPYLSEPGQSWNETTHIKLLEYVPFYLLLALSALRRTPKHPPNNDPTRVFTP